MSSWCSSTVVKSWYARVVLKSESGSSAKKVSTRASENAFRGRRVVFSNRVFRGKRADRPAATTVGNRGAAVSRSAGRRGRLRPARRRRCRAVGRPPLRLVDGTAAARAAATPHDPVAADRTAARNRAAFLSCNSRSTVILSRRRRRSRFSSPVSAAPRSVSTSSTQTTRPERLYTDVRTAGCPRLRGGRAYRRRAAVARWSRVTTSAAILPWSGYARRPCATTLSPGGITPCRFSSPVRAANPFPSGAFRARTGIPGRRALPTVCPCRKVKHRLRGGTPGQSISVRRRVYMRVSNRVIICLQFFTRPRSIHKHTPKMFSLTKAVAPAVRSAVSIQ